MTRDRQRLADYLAHIIEAIERIESYTEDMDDVAFLTNQLVQDAVMRNAVAHGYFKVDFELVWRTIHSDLPALHAGIQNARTALARPTLPG
jgi:uncharacterized protein with HEPN domain